MERCLMQAGQHNLPLYLLPLLLIVLWSLASILVGVMSGWHKLAKRFTAESEPVGEVHTAGPFFFTVYWRFWSHYSSIVRVTSARDALYLSVILPYRIGHPPLCIPWSQIILGKEKRYWRTYIVLTLGDEERIPLRISERMARKLEILERLPSYEPASN